MAICYLRVGFIGRSSGRSAVQAVAYMCGKNLYEDRRGLYTNFDSKSSHVAASDTLYPDHSRYKDISVWNAVENFEDIRAEQKGRTPETREKFKATALTAMTIIAALPIELSLNENKELVEKFINKEFISKNLISTYAIHTNSEGNPHVHILITRRAIEEHGGFKNTKEKGYSKGNLLALKKDWADMVNFYLEKNGINERITEKSYYSLGIDLEPTKHIGWYAYNNPDSITAKENQAIKERNKQKILENPYIIIDYMNKINWVFTEQDFRKELGKRGLNEFEISKVEENLMENNLDQLGSEQNEKEFFEKIDRYKDKLTDSCPSEILIQNILSENADLHAENSELHLQTYGYRLQVNQTMIKKYINNFQLDIPDDEGLSKLASLIADKQQNEVNQISIKTVNSSIKEALCFYVLNQENAVRKALHPSSDVQGIAIKLANHLTDDNISVLNNKQLMQEALLKVTPSIEIDLSVDFSKAIMDNHSLETLINTIERSFEINL